jgi:hypothetical protein
MIAALHADSLPWDLIERSRAFITGVYTDPAPQRPGVLMHFPPPTERPPPPSGLTRHQQNAWTQLEGLRHRPVGYDDFVPALATGAGTCAMATAFGCPEVQQGGVSWVEPVIADLAHIDRLRPPALTAGRLGDVLEQTRAFAADADPRLAVRIMDFQSPFTTCEQMLGSERFFTMPCDDPRRLHALMDVVTDFAIAFFKAQTAAAGDNVCPGSWPTFWFPRAAGIQMSDDNMVNVAPEVYDEFVVPYNNRIAEAFGGLFLHSCTIREANLPSLRKLRRLTGINCDVSSSVSAARLLEAFGRDVVVAPHAYINTGTAFANYGEFVAHALDGWRPGLRLFIHPCSVMYLPAASRELPFDRQEVEAELARHGITAGPRSERAGRR